MPWKFDTPGCDDCDPDCERVDDQFATDTIADYTQASGTWSIDDGVLSTSSDNAVITSNTTGQIYQRVTTRFRSPDRQAVKLLGGLTSGVVYVYASVEFDTEGTCGWLELRNKTAISDTRIGERRRVDGLVPADWHDLALCIRPNGNLSEVAIYGTLDDACLYNLLEQTPGVGVGLGTGGASGDVEFEYLTWTDSKTDDNECPACNCPCEASTDDFERPDSETTPEGVDGIGCLWVRCDGFWRITQQALVGWGDAAAQHLVPIDPRSKEQYGSVLARGVQGTKAVLLMGYECGGSATMSAVIEFWDAKGKSKLAISKDNGATYENGWKYIDTTDAPEGRGFVRLEACLRDGYFYARAAGERVTAADTGAADAVFIGLGVGYHSNGTTTTGQRQPVFFEDFQSGSSGSPCGTCGGVEGGPACCHCADRNTPTTLLVTQPALTQNDVTGICDCANTAASVLLNLTAGNVNAKGTCLSAECCHWGGSNVPTGCSATPGSGGGVSLCTEAGEYVLRYTLVSRWFNTIDHKTVWSKNLGEAVPDCASFNETLTVESTTGLCLGTGTTVNVKAV